MGSAILPSFLHPQKAENADNTTLNGVAGLRSRKLFGGAGFRTFVRILNVAPDEPSRPPKSESGLIHKGWLSAWKVIRT
jgi:hypothetical protein